MQPIKMNFMLDKDGISMFDTGHEQAAPRNPRPNPLHALRGAFHDEKVRDVKARRVQVDEIWSFTYAKQKNVPSAKRQDLAYGDTWTWTAIEADTKLLITWLVGGRDGDYAMGFMDDLRARLANRVQLTSDGHRAYLEAVEGAFGGDVDYAQLVKLYGAAPES